MKHLSTDLFKDLFKTLGGLQFLVRADMPDFTLVAATSDIFTLFSLHPEAVIGKPIGQAVAHLSSSEHIKAYEFVVGKFIECCVQKTRITIDEVRFDFPMLNGVLREMHWEIQLNPVLNEQGEVAFVSYSARDVSERVKLRQNYELSKRQNYAFETFKGSKNGVLILVGPDLKIAFANAMIESLWGHKSGFMDQRISEVFPELESQGYLTMLNDVYNHGDSVMAHEASIIIEKQGQPYRGYYDFVIKPYFTDASKPHVGLLCMVTDVTEKVNERIKMNLRRGSFELTDDIRDFGVFTIDFYTKKATFSNQIAAWLDRDEIDNFDDLLPLFHRDDLIKVKGEINDFNQGRKTHLDFVFRMVHPNTQQTHYLRTLIQLQELNAKGAIVSGLIQDISYKIKSERAIHHSANRLKSVIEAAPFPIAIYTGGQFILELTNNALLHYFDKSMDDIGRTCKDVFPIYSQLGLLKKIEKVWNTGNSIKENDVYIEFYRKGELIKAYISYNLTPLHDENGNIYGILHTTFDVTEVNMSKSLIEENEFRYRTFIEEAPLATALYLGDDFRITYANSLMLDLWNKSSEVIGKTLSEGLPEIHKYQYYDILVHVYKTGELYSGYEFEIKNPNDPDGQKRYINFQYKALMDKEGRIYGILNTAWDVTSEVMGRRFQEETQKNFRNMIMQAPIAIMILRGQEMRVELVNPVMIELININPASVYNRPIDEVVSEFKQRDWNKIVVQLFITGGSYISEEEEYTFKRNGEEYLRYLRFNFEPMRDSAGVINGVMVVAHDITQQVLMRKRIEFAVSKRTEELANANAQLKISNSQLEQFAYIASHDLQEPLRKISLFNQLLQSQLSENEKEKVNYYMDRIGNSVQRMTNLIRDILGYSQLSLDQIQYERVNLDEVLQEVLDEFDVMIANKKAKITTTTLGEVEGLRMQIVQLFQNLISNSLKYIPADRAPHILISAKICDEPPGLPPINKGYCHLQFIDNGIGFDQDYSDKIFTIFQRLHGKNQYEGTGIGLAMCKKIIENHHGAILASGQVDHGAQFDVYLPIKQN